MTDNFVMRCPKCFSTGLERFVDRATAWASRDDITLKCRNCGKMIYGKKRVEDEWKRQKTEWKRNAPERRAQQAADEQRRREQESQRVAVDRSMRFQEQAQRERTAADAAKREADTRAWLETTAAKPKPKPDPEPEPELLFVDPGGSECAWTDCRKPARATSLYCSRNCSNKNARHRHRMRQKGRNPDHASA